MASEKKPFPPFETQSTAPNVDGGTHASGPRRDRMAAWVCAFFCIWGCVCLYCFTDTLLYDLRASELEPFEIAARIIGYGLSLAVTALSAVCAYRTAGKRAIERPAWLAMLLSFFAVLLLDAHDVLLYETYGNTLEGTFSMTAFFAMDAALTVLYLVMLRLHRKGASRRAFRYLCAAVALVWALYLVGDMAGYPAASVQDWDEALMKTPFLFLVLFLLVWPRERKGAEAAASKEPLP